ncbi:MAG: inositol-phosphate phosphatase [Gammaproteobacteria bacterium]|nr:inositol-phosphate phosphatase [Gammaproteobacteria bacterium]MDH3768034.1 inositol-phosphate phosphatase [Gammaproteobacteria bacterium]
MEKAMEAAAAAADIQRHYYQGNVSVQLKADRTPVTIADLESEKTIKEILSQAFPGDGFFGEESGASDMDAEYVWLVDPLDGTKSFVRGYPFFSVQIALMRADEIILGVSNAPVFAEVATAEKGGGAFINDVPVRISDVDQFSDMSLSTGNTHTLAQGPQWAQLGKLISNVSRIRGYGDFYHYHLLAAGKIDAVIESDVNILDIAALSLLIKEAGGRFTDLAGQAVGLATTSVLATNYTLHDPILAMLSGEG